MKIKSSPIVSTSTDTTSGYLVSSWALDSSTPPSKRASRTRRVSSPTPVNGLQRCSRCSYTGVASSFPMRRTGAGYLKSCASCISKQVMKKAEKADKVLPSVCSLTVPTMSLDQYLSLVRSNKDQTFEFDAFVEIPEGIFHQDGEHLYSRTNKLRDRLAEVSEYHWK
jgi:hypothetical protein